jgi:hypothetical protein
MLAGTTSAQWAVKYGMLARDIHVAPRQHSAPVGLSGGAVMGRREPAEISILHGVFCAP